MAGKKGMATKIRKNRSAKQRTTLRPKFDGPLARGIRTVAGLLPYGEKVKQFADFVFSMLVTYQRTQTDAGSDTVVVNSEEDFRSDNILQFGCGGAFLINSQMLMTGASNVGLIAPYGGKSPLNIKPDYQYTTTNYSRAQAQYVTVSAEATAGMTAKGVWGVGLRVITDVTEFPELMADVLASGMGLEALKRCQHYVVGKATHNLKLNKRFSFRDGDAYKPKSLTDGANPEQWIAACIVVWSDVNRPVGSAPVTPEEFQCMIQLRGGVRLSCRNMQTTNVFNNNTFDLLHGIDAFISAPLLKDQPVLGVKVKDWNNVKDSGGRDRRTCVRAKIVHAIKVVKKRAVIKYAEELKTSMTTAATSVDNGLPWSHISKRFKCPDCSSWVSSSE